MKSYSIVFLILSHIITVLSVPCPLNCQDCSSATQCTDCAAQYYSSTQSGAIQCLPCSEYCLSCTSDSECTRCADPYVLGTDKLCHACEVNNALRCQNVVSASACQSTYYVSDNYCSNCLLNCADCFSLGDCSDCVPGFYLNTSVLTCNPCPSNCLTCDQYTPSKCTSCADGYQLSSNQSCDSIECQIEHCRFCQSPTVCKQCEQFYYWNGQCMLGASVLCSEGAVGLYSNQCARSCDQYQYEVTSGTTLACKIYRNVDVGSYRFAQLYYYAYNQLNQLQSLVGTANPLTQESNGEYSYNLQGGDTLTLPSLPSYYRITLILKYRSSTAIELSLSAKTESLTQNESFILPTHPSPAGSSDSTLYLHSNNLQISPNSSIYLIQVLLRIRKCPDDCHRCLNEQYCEMCHQPQYVLSYNCVDNCTIFYHYTINRTCLVSCPQQFYPTELGTNQKFCEPCASPCLHCLSSTNCLSCQSGLYLYNYTCLQTCQDKYYPSDATGQCEPCISPCKSCLNQTSCLSCDEGFWNGSMCVSYCPVGYYADTGINQCKICQSPCLSCQKSATECLSCESGLFYHELTCSTSCPERYYPVNGSMTCTQCRSPCLTCVSAVSCLSCSYHYLYNDQCLATCPDGHYESVSSKSCEACPSSCLTCSSANECLSCLTDTCLLHSLCIPSCPYGNYYNSTNSEGQCSCLECKYPCKQCESASLCLSCLEGYLHNGTCRSICPDSTYTEQSSFTCQPCLSKFSNCLQCSASTCKRCANSLMLHNGSCVSSCPQLYYKQSEKCAKCIAPCLACTSFTSCLSCVSPYILFGASCIIQCRPTEVSIQQPDNSFECIKCQSPCLSCSVTTTNCTICQFGSYLSQSSNMAIENQCITNCSTIQPLFSLYNEPASFKCTLCLFPCLTCASQSQCLSCRIGYLTGNQCENCPSGTYPFLGVCHQCRPECVNCYSEDYCISCESGYYLYGHTCINDTSLCINNGYYVIGGTCQPCQMPCTTCELTSTNCLSCVSGFIFDSPNSCLIQCPSGTYRNSSVCSPCHQYCETCSTHFDYCFSCNSPYVFVLNKMSCVTTCPEKTYLEGDICQSCRYPCLECSSMANCLSCISGTLIDDQCLTSCQSGYYSDAQLVCQLCTSPCKQCEDSSTFCTVCEDDYYLHENQCKQTCPSEYFGENEAKQCLECLGLCQECTSHINCTTCANNLIYFQNTKKGYGECLSSCPISYYVTGTSKRGCAACLPECLTCQDNVSCILCNNNFQQFEGACFQECPETMFSDNGVCQACSTPCYNCTDAFTCTSCLNESSLLVGSAECVVGQICPVGYYRITATNYCNSSCPQGEYHQQNRTCSSVGCPPDYYLGKDFHCYTQCPEGFIANQTFHCNECSGPQCLQGLFFNISYEVWRNQLSLYLIFTEQPVYQTEITRPIISLHPDFKHEIYLSLTRRLLQAQGSSQSMITIQLLPEESLGQFELTVMFSKAFQTYKNPLQRTSKKVYIEGFDYYQQDLQDFNIGLLLLFCGLVGLFKIPYMTDFSQLVYLLALMNINYPMHLASLLESGSLAHLSRIVAIDQELAEGPGKFSHITNMGLLSNCTLNLIILISGLACFLILLIAYRIAQKMAHYNHVNQQIEEPNLNLPTAPNSQQLNCKIKLIKCLQTYFINDFINQYLNRLIYFNYLPLAVFTFAQLSVTAFQTEYPNDFIASAITIPMLVLLIAYPVFIFRYGKPKYSFLMLRKIVLAAALVLSVRGPTYMIGVVSVLCLTTAVLVYSYKLEHWVQETRFVTAMEIAQFVLLALFAIFEIVRTGEHTRARVNIGWVIIFLVLAIALLYLSFSIFLFGLWVCKVARGRDYIQEWQSNEQKSENGTDSEQTNQQLKSESQKSCSKSIQVPKVLADSRKHELKSEQKGLSNPKKPGVSNQFWTYNDDNSSHKQTQNQPPEMLIRCVNEFSDYDGSSHAINQNKIDKNKQVEGEDK